MSLLKTSVHGAPLVDFAADAYALDMAAFVQRHGSVFFFRLGSNQPVSRGHYSRTRSESSNGTDAAVMFVIPILGRDSNDQPFISIGRLDSNDVAIEGPTVSKFHAYLKETAGSFAIHDAGSRNGTFVGEARVTVRGEGRPTLLVANQPLRLGNVELRFVDAAWVMNLARSISFDEAPTTGGLLEGLAGRR